MITSNIQAHGAYSWSHIGWRYYNQIREKAMEREFSWSGLWLSLSIAFFIVFATAQVLSLAYQSYERVQGQGEVRGVKIYQMERADYLQPAAATESGAAQTNAEKIREMRSILSQSVLSYCQVENQFGNLG